MPQAGENQPRGKQSTNKTMIIVCRHLMKHPTLKQLPLPSFLDPPQVYRQLKSYLWGEHSWNKDLDKAG